MDEIKASEVLARVREIREYDVERRGKASYLWLCAQVERDQARIAELEAHFAKLRDVVFDASDPMTPAPAPQQAPSLWAMERAEQAWRSIAWGTQCTLPQGQVDKVMAAFAAALEAVKLEGTREGMSHLGFGEIVMLSEQRARPGHPPRWTALARNRKTAATADTEAEARIAALAIPAAK